MLRKNLLLAFLGLTAGTGLCAQGEKSPVSLQYDVNGVANVSLKTWCLTGKVHGIPRQVCLRPPQGGWTLTLYLDNEDFSNVGYINVATDESTDKGYACLVNDVQVIAPDGKGLAVVGTVRGGVPIMRHNGVGIRKIRKGRTNSFVPRLPVTCLMERQTKVVWDPWSSSPLRW